MQPPRAAVFGRPTADCESLSCSLLLRSECDGLQPCSIYQVRLGDHMPSQPHGRRLPHRLDRHHDRIGGRPLRQTGGHRRQSRTSPAAPHRASSSRPWSNLSTTAPSRFAIDRYVEPEYTKSGWPYVLASAHSDSLLPTSCLFVGGCRRRCRCRWSRPCRYCCGSTGLPFQPPRAPAARTGSRSGRSRKQTIVGHRAPVDRTDPGRRRPGFDHGATGRGRDQSDRHVQVGVDLASEVVADRRERRDGFGRSGLRARGNFRHRGAGRHLRHCRTVGSSRESPRQSPLPPRPPPWPATPCSALALTVAYLDSRYTNGTANAS